MNFIDISFAGEPVNTDSFQFLHENDYPTVMIGFIIKNKYDQERLQIKKIYNPVNYIHFLTAKNIQPMFLRGLKITAKSKYIPLINQLEQLNLTLPAEINLKFYNNLLSEYNLTCDDCFSFLQKGIYPIDGKYISDIAKETYNLEDLYANSFDDICPSFQRLGYYTIFVLSNKTTTSFKLDNFIKELNDHQKLS